MRARSNACAFLVAAICASPAFAATTYLKATFNTAGNYRGCGPEATGGAWDPAGVEVGTGTIVLCGTFSGQPDSSLYVDPTVGLEGSSKAFRLNDKNDGSTLLQVQLDPAQSVPTQSSVSWVQYTVRIDPASYGTYSDSLLSVTLWNTGGIRLVSTSLGKSSEGKLRYKLYWFDGSTQIGDLGALKAGDDWRVLIKIDPVAHKQTHWVFRNGVAQFDPLLGTPLDFHQVPGSATPLDLMQFQTPYEGTAPYLGTTNALVDEIKVSTTAPPSLKASPIAAGRIDLTWIDNATDETGYRVQRSNDGHTWSQLGSDLAANSTTYSDTTATLKQRYYYRVGALGAGGTVDWSNTAYAFAVYTGGPLSDWINVKDPSIASSACGNQPAVGDGVADDTCALQNALSLLNNAIQSDDPRVLYFPNGTYKIRQSLVLEGQFGPELIGQSAGGVIIQWDASSNNVGTKDPCTGVVSPMVMFTVDAPYHLVVRNLLFDGGRTSTNETYVVAFDLSTCPSSPAHPSYGECNGQGNTWYQRSNTKGNVDVGTGIFDSTFRNAWIGLRISHFNYQDSDMSIRRSQFLNNEFGTSIEDPNALQIHFWDCTWDNNRARAITNYILNFGGTDSPANPGTLDWAGDFTVERGRFSNNGQDIYYVPTGQFRVRDSWSTGSGMFLFGYGVDPNPAQFIISNTYVADTSPIKILDDYDTMDGCLLGNTACRCTHGVGLQRGRVIANLNSGALVLLDNKFDPRKASDSWMTNPANTQLVLDTAEPIFATSSIPSAVFALSNRYTAAQPYELAGVNLKLTNLDDLINPTPLGLTPPQPPVPVDILANHAVFTVTDAANAQDVINAATAAAQSSAVAVHFPTNKYLLTATLNVPAVLNDLVITGSGTSTDLQWYGAGPGPMMKVGGYHAKTTVRDLSFHAKNGTSKADGLVVEDVNSTSTRVFMNQVGTYVPQAVTPGIPVTGGLEIDRADLTKVDIFDFNATGWVVSYPPAVYDDFMMKVTAGPQAQTVKSVWTSDSGGASASFVGVNGPQGLKWLIAGSYMESAERFLDVSGNGGTGNVEVLGARMPIEYSTDTAAVQITDFPGNVSVVSSQLQDLDPYAFGLPSRRPTTGANIRQTGSVPIDIESIGNLFLSDPGYEKTSSATFTRASDAIHVCDSANTYCVCQDPFTYCPQTGCATSVTVGPCLDYFENPAGSGLYYRGSSHPGENFSPMTDLCTVMNPNCGDSQRLYSAFDLYRTTEIPHHYDEPGAKETYQVNLDNVKVWDPITGIHINGGPAAPSGLTGTAISATQVNLTWVDNSANEDGFKVRRATASAGPYSNLSPNPGPGATSFSDTTTQEATQYWYSVVAYRTASAESGPALTGPVSTPPRTPTGLTASGTGPNPIAVLLGWIDNSSAETGFPVERATVSGGPYAVVATAPAKPGTGSTSYSDTNNLIDGTRYWYRVSAAKTGFPNSPTAGPMSATTPILPPAPFSGQALTGRVNRLTWTDHSATESGFEVQRSPKTGNNCNSYATIGTAPASAGTELQVTYDDVGSGLNHPKAGNTYCYRVRSTNALVQSAWVTGVTLTTLP
jgi:hypothetical protein